VLIKFVSSDVSELSYVRPAGESNLTLLIPVMVLQDSHKRLN
jgi:hypothetical protein